MRRAIAVPVTFILLLAATAFGQQMDPAFRGVWTLDLAQSDFGERAKPKMGTVNWTDQGWTFALLTADGRLMTDGVITARGCTLIGNPADYSCDFAVIAPRHVRLMIKQGEEVRLVGDMELLDDNTTKVTHRRTPSKGAPYTDLAIWKRKLQSAPAPTASSPEEAVARVDDERRNAYLTNDAATLDRILADDVTIITGIGTEDGKRTTLADVRSHDLTYTKLTYDHRKIRIYGDTAIVTSHAEIGAKYKYRDLSGKLLVTRIYINQGGSWRLMAVQSTRLPP